MTPTSARLTAAATPIQLLPFNRRQSQRRSLENRGDDSRGLPDEVQRRRHHSVQTDERGCAAAAEHVLSLLRHGRERKDSPLINGDGVPESRAPRCPEYAEASALARSRCERTATECSGPTVRRAGASNADDALKYTGVAAAECPRIVHEQDETGRHEAV